MRMKIALVTCLTLWMTLALFTETTKKELRNQVRRYRQAHEFSIIKEFRELLAIPNVSADTKNIRKNAAFIKHMMMKRGIQTRILETEGNPVVFGELKAAGAEQTLLFYVHYDGQPVDPSQWTDSKPFQPVLRPGKLKAGSNSPTPVPFPPPGRPLDENWRIYARGSSDDKAPIIALLTAIDALNASGVKQRNNLKFIFEGEEEAGSPNLRPFLEKNKDLLKADILFMCDGPAYFSGDPTFFFGVRGIVTMELKVYGPNTSVHSGHYGNWAPNPAIRLARLLASMKDDSGRVTIKGFYDTVVPLTPRELKAIKEAPNFDAQLKTLYGFSGTDSAGLSLLEAIQQPSLNINGLRSGWVGEEARTIVPPHATASIDIRLVKGNDPPDMVGKVIAHIKKQGYHVTETEPAHKERMTYPLLVKAAVTESGYRAARTAMDHPLAVAALDTLDGYFDNPPVSLPSLGGSLPIYLFEETLNIPIIGISIVNYDNNQHQPNENLRIGHLWKGIETFAAIMLTTRRVAPLAIAQDPAHRYILCKMALR